MKGHGKFCSKPCALVGRRQPRGEDHPLWKGGPAKWDRTGSGEWKLCEGCGTRYFAARRKYKWCSAACHHRHVTRQPTPGLRQVMKTGYIRLTIEDGTRVAEHRYVWEQANGPIPKGGMIHHVNHDKTDNRLENLVLVRSHREHVEAHGGSLNERRARVPDCHPKRKHAAHGLCKSCYMIQWKAARRAA